MAIFLESPQQASKWCVGQRNENKTVGYVPTMGALHEGHLSLVRRSVEQNDATCVSIFVNPLQFNNPDDLKKYPRDTHRDIALLAKHQCDMVYTGSLLTFFPEYDDESMILSALSECTESQSIAMQGLEADFRPGHLEGVEAIVERLLATVGSCRTYFGEKDFQQLLVVKDIARRIGNVEVVPCSTRREQSGLAMSSRNSRLDQPQTILAATLYKALQAARDAWVTGERSPARLQAVMNDVLRVDGIKVEYAEIRDPNRWTSVQPGDTLQHAQALIAAWIGEVRLIDNLRLDQ